MSVNEYFNAKQKARKNNYDQVSMENLKEKSKAYKNIISKSVKMHKNKYVTEIRKLKANDPSVYYKKLNSACGFNDPNQSLDVDIFVKHFANLCFDTSKKKEEAHVFTPIVNPTLDKVITQEEILLSISKLKNNKSSGGDMIINEFLKHAKEALLPSLNSIFNLDGGYYPQEWPIGNLLPLYKKDGDKKDPNNYRGITLLSCLGKLFTNILDRRLTQFSDSKGIMGEEQAGLLFYC